MNVNTIFIFFSLSASAIDFPCNVSPNKAGSSQIIGVFLLSIPDLSKKTHPMQLSPALFLSTVHGKPEPLLF